ncbi:MAG: beta-eliminating lyase-related protein, partial [Anaerolineales bacterium]
KTEFPGQALAIELYREGGVRVVELGSVAFAYPDPDTGEMIHPRMELVRLAIPRRVYTQSHMDYVARCLKKIANRKRQIPGYRITYAPELLRHFTAKFQPIQ